MYCVLDFMFINFTPGREKLFRYKALAKSKAVNLFYNLVSPCFKKNCSRLGVEPEKNIWMTNQEMLSKINTHLTLHTWASIGAMKTLRNGFRYLGKAASFPSGPSGGFIRGGTRPPSCTERVRS